MSYEKIAVSGDIPARVIFYYVIDDLFTSISARSIMVAEKIPNADGNPSIDEYAISDDEKAIFISEYLRRACSIVFGLLDKLTFGLTTTEVFNDDYDSNGDSVGKYILDKAGYLTDSLISIDQSIEIMLKNHVLANWFRNCSLISQSEQFDLEFAKAKKEFLIKRTKLYKPLLS